MNQVRPPTFNPLKGVVLYCVLLQDKVNSLYLYRDHYFENHKIEDAIHKNGDIEKRLAEILDVFDRHENSALETDRARYNFLRGRLLNVIPKYSKEAENLLSKAIKLDPKLVDAWNELGECFFGRMMS
jgi:hypothetical protein